jgi:hypothetical protein
MPKSQPLIDTQGEVREVLAADLKAFAPATQALPASLQHKLNALGAQKAPAKERTESKASQAR